MPERSRVGTSRVRTEYLTALRDAWRDRQLVLFLGAGVSIPYGIPAWRDLVLQLLLHEGGQRFDGFAPHYRHALAAWLSDRFDFSPTLLARVVKYQVAKRGAAPTRTSNQVFADLLRDKLYATCVDAPHPSALQEVAQLIQRSEEERRRIRAVVTFNFDDLLEEELRKLRVPTTPVIGNAGRMSKDFPVVHVHGYVPRRGEISAADLVFTEDEYHRLTFSAFHWSVTDIVQNLRNTTALFIGLSMGDPNLRRLLDATHTRDQGIRHFAIRPDYALTPEEIGQAAREVESRAELQRRLSGEAFRKSAESLDSAVREMLKQAHTYDRRLFKDMGVGLLWVKKFDDIPPLLRAISTGTRGAERDNNALERVGTTPHGAPREGVALQPEQIQLRSITK